MKPFLLARSDNSKKMKTCLRPSNHTHLGWTESDTFGLGVVGCISLMHHCAQHLDTAQCSVPFQMSPSTRFLAVYWLPHQVLQSGHLDLDHCWAVNQHVNQHAHFQARSVDEWTSAQHCREKKTQRKCHWLCWPSYELCHEVVELSLLVFRKSPNHSSMDRRSHQPHVIQWDHFDHTFCFLKTSSEGSGWIIWFRVRLKKECQCHHRDSAPNKQLGARG